MPLKLLLVFLGLSVLSACGSGTGAIDELFGSSSTPVLTSVPNQTVAQTDELIVDVNNILNGVPGDDKDMSYTCYYDQTVDDKVDDVDPCTSLPNSLVDFNPASGILKWTPSSMVLGNYEFKINGTNPSGKYSEIFTVGVRLKFGGLESYTNISGVGATLNWTPNTAAIGYQIYKLNTFTGQYEFLSTISGGGTSSHILTGLVPNSPYTLRLNAIDVLGFPDSNVNSRSFTTNSLTKFSMSPVTATVAAGSAQTITVQAFNSNDTPQVVGGLNITPQIQSGSSTGNFGPMIDNNDGTYTFTFTPLQVGTPAVIEVTSNTTFFLNNTTTTTVIPGPPSNVMSSIQISSGTVISSSAVTVTATVRDGNNNPIIPPTAVTINKIGGTSTGNLSPLTHLGNGVYTATYTGVVAGTAQTLSMTVAGTTLTPTTTIQVLPGAPVSVNSTLTISSTTVSSGSAVNINATLRDINNNPVPSGILVAFNKSGGTSSGSFSAVVNAGAGSYTTTYTGLVAGSAQTLTVSADGLTLTPTVSITVVPGAAVLANSNLNISAPTVVSGQFVTVTATLKDANSNPIESGITVSFSKTGGTSTGTFGSVTNQGGGVYNIRYTGVVAGTDQTIRVLINGVDLGTSVTVGVTPGAPSSTLSTIAISSGNVVSGNSVTITATLRDASSNLISSGVLVGISVTGGTSTGSLSSITNAGSGVYTATYTGIIAGSAQTLGITTDSSPLGPTTTVTVLPGAVNLTNSSLVTDSATIVSGTYATLTATLRDVNNNPIAAASTVTFSKTGGTSTGNFGTVTNQGSGVYTVRYTGVVAGTAQTIRVLINSVDVGFTVTETVTPGSPSPVTSTISTNLSSIVSGNSATITATVRDANNNPISSGILVSFSKTGGTSTGNFSSVTNMGSGQYAINYEGVIAGSAQTIGLIVDAISLGPTTSITVVPGAPSNLLTTLTVSSNSVISGNTTTLTATVKDANNNPISSGITVTFDKTGGTSFGNLSAVTNQGNGVYTSVYTGITAGTANTLQTNVNGTAIGPTQNVQVLVGAPYTANSSLTVAPTTLASGAVATISAVIRDVNNNPITSEYAITFDTQGGSSTGTLGSVNNAGSGNFSTTYTGVLAGSAQTVRVLSDGVPISGLTRTVQVTPGAVDPSNSLFTIGSSTVQSGSTTNLNMNLRDANNNAISSGLTVSFNKTLGVSNGNISGVSNGGGGNYSATYTGTTQGAAQTITLVANGTTIPTLNVSVTVTAGPPVQISIVGPSNPRQSIDCDGPYTVTLLDAASNITVSTAPLTIAFSSAGSAHTGTLFSDSSCNSTQPSMAIAANISQGAFYYKSYRPQSITMTLTPSIGTIAANTVAITNLPVLSWLGSAARFTMAGFGSESVADDTSGFYNPQGIASDGSYLYAVDATYHRIVKIDLANNQLIGWLGHVGSVEGIKAYDNGSGCDGLNISTGDMTPVWCKGGRSNTGNSSIITGLRYIAVDSTYIYVTSATLHRILRFNKTTGAYEGWIGRILASPGSGVCASSDGLAAPGWCMGGTSQTGTLDGHLNNPQGLSAYGGYIYVADNTNMRIQRFNAATGKAAGWIGLVNAAPENWVGQLGTCSPIPAGNVKTPGWCLSGTTGTAKQSDRYNLSTNPSEVLAPDEGFKSVTDLTNDGTYLYAADASNVRVVRINLTSGAFSGFIGSVVSRSLPGNQPSPATLANTYTNGWTQGGITYPRDTTAGFGVIRGLANDGTYLYIADDYHKLIRVQLSDGLGYKWIGRVAASPTGGYIGCSSTPVSGVTPGWCLGGTGSRLGNTDSAFYNPYGVAYSSTTSRIYVADYNNFRIQSFDLTDGYPTGWIGAENATATKWTRTIASDAHASRGGIDDYSFLESAASYNSISMNNTLMFQTDFASGRIKKFDRLTGLMLGYIGQIGTFAPTGPSACVGFTSGMTPNWCTGGGRNSNGGTGIHGYNNPYAVTADATHIYIANYSNHRVDRVRISDALYRGWIGRVNGIPTDGDDPDCLNATATNPTPNWCIGGSASSGSVNGMFNAPRALYYESPYLYVTDNSSRLMRIDPADGSFEGAIGRTSAGTGCTVTSSTAQGWCDTATGAGTGGTAYGGINTSGGIAMNSTYIFVSDTGGNRVTRWEKSSGAPAGIVGRMTNATNLNVNAITGGACASLPATGYPKPLPGWCWSNSAGQNLATSAGSEDGSLNSPRAIWANEDYVYVADSGNNRIVRYDANTGGFAGWKGLITSTSSMTPPSCVTAGTAPNTGVSPTWCYGGGAGPGKQLGVFDNPHGLYGDANYLYVLDGRNNRTMTIPLN